MSGRVRASAGGCAMGVETHTLGKQHATVGLSDDGDQLTVFCADKPNVARYATGLAFFVSTSAFVVAADLLFQEPTLVVLFSAIACASMCLAFSVGLCIAARSRTSLHLAGGQLTYRQQFVFFSRWRRLPLAEVTRSRRAETLGLLGDYSTCAVHGAEDLITYEVPSRLEPCVELETLGEPIVFARGIPPVVQDRIISEINAYLRDWGNLRHQESSSPLLSVGHPAPSGLPSESPLSLRRLSDGIEVWCHGRWTLGTLYFLLFSTLCMSILGISLSSVGGTLGGLLLLGPLALANAALLPTLALMLTAPIWEVRWTLRPSGIVTTWRAPGLSWSRTLTFGEAAAVEPRRLPLKQPPELFSIDTWIQTYRPGARYGLWFIPSASSEIMGIAGLTEGEAVFVRELLLKEFPDCFKRERIGVGSVFEENGAAEKGRNDAT
jgi:hypothetical protein